MPKRVALWVACLVAAVVLAAAAMGAQPVQLPPNQYHMLSGSDVGFRVEGTDASGKPVGTWMVKVDGKWIEPGMSVHIHPTK